MHEFERIRDIWFIGGAHIYRDALTYVDFIDQVTIPWACGISCGITAHNIVTAPKIDTSVFDGGPTLQHPDERELSQRTWVRRGKLDFADVERWYARRYEDPNNELCRQQGSMSR